MKPSIALQENRAAILAVVQSHRARNARVFGSVLHGNDHEDSDLDILIDPTPETTMFSWPRVCRLTNAFMRSLWATCAEI